MKLFLDTSVLLAASGSISGASYAILQHYGPRNKWSLITSPYCLAEVENNIEKLPLVARNRWRVIQKSLNLTADVLTLNQPSLLTRGKDKPVLFTAISYHADALLTLDTTDFKIVLNTIVYGVEVRTPAGFLMDQRNKNRLIE